jgi:hypothetical protein
MILVESAQAFAKSVTRKRNVRGPVVVLGSTEITREKTPSPAVESPLAARFPSSNIKKFVGLAEDRFRK